VEIFYTQVFRDGFFHADMHPATDALPLKPYLTSILQRPDNCDLGVAIFIANPASWVGTSSNNTRKIIVPRAIQERFKSYLLYI
jgi:hypothetical protein